MVQFHELPVISCFLKFQAYLFSSPKSEEALNAESDASLLTCVITLACLMAIVEGWAATLCCLSKRYPNLFTDESHWWREEETSDQRAARVEKCLKLSAFPSEVRDCGAGPCCSVCLGDFEHGEVIVSGARKCCNNTYHKECLSTWLQVQSTCPCCRHEILGKGSSRLSVSNTSDG